MKTKMVGIGKCGSRMTYDFFAYISGMPTSYNIRIKEKKALQGVVTSILENFQFAKVRKWIQESFGETLIIDYPSFVTIDSDRANNEILGLIELLNESGGTKIMFPGKTFPFHNHRGGCDYHVVSENICSTWTFVPDEIATFDNYDIYATAFSIGGGTGGGAAPILAQNVKRTNKSMTDQVHFMGIGVLPISDEIYTKDSITGAMASNEKYNTGRFVCGLARNHVEKTKALDSVWLISNDILRMVGSKKIENQSPLSDPNLAYVNKYAASVLTTICNASSQGTRSETNFDSIEMNNRLNGRPVISAFSFSKVSKENDLLANLATLKGLFNKAMSNPRFVGDDLMGLSVPIREEEISAVEVLLRNNYTESVEQFVSRLKDLTVEALPLEFRTAERVVLLYGQPKSMHSTHKDEIAKLIVSGIFKNSDPSFYPFQHAGNTDIVVVLIVNPLVRVLQNSIYYYIGQSWVENRSESSSLAPFLDAVIVSKNFDEKAVQSVLSATEILKADTLGVGTLNVISQVRDPIFLTRADVVYTLREMHRMYHNKKFDVGRSRI